MHRTVVILAALTLLLAAPASALADTTTVTTSGVTFVSADIVIQLGDSVKWVLGSPAINHTITSGNGSGDPNVGALFDQPFNPANDTFVYTFSDTTGIYPYFCRPHEGVDMRGTVTVEEITSVPGPAANARETWGRVKSLFR